MAASSPRFRFSIDRGGTFCDVHCLFSTDGFSTSEETVEKLLSECPSAYADAPTEGIRRVLRRVYKQLGLGDKAAQVLEGPVPTGDIDTIRMGTTVATNALLERRGEPFFLVSGPGMADLAAIGNQSRPDIFDLEIKRMGGLQAGVLEVSARVRVITEANSGMEYCGITGPTRGDESSGDGVSRSPDPAGAVVVGTTGELVFVESPVDVMAVTEELRRIRKTGVKTLAVALLHSYTYPHHELEIQRIAIEECGFEHVSVSCRTVAMTRAVPRTLTTCVDAYLTPVLRRYVDGFLRGFDGGAGTDSCPVLFMQSDGGLTDARSFTGHRSILSGPAGGVVGYAATAYVGPDSRHEPTRREFSFLGLDASKPVIGFDMGGTSTDVSRFAGRLEHVFDAKIAGIDVQSPHLDITTVAAGGGSLLEFFAGMFQVGPGSAGAFPGPVCYRNPGGKLAVTDANVLLGRIAPSLFPAIFGPNKDEPLDVEGPRRAFEKLAEQVNSFYAEKAKANGQPPPTAHTCDTLADGYLQVANESMCRPIRQITQARGVDPQGHRLSCFGGAGGQHACSVARSLGMGEVLVHRHCGVLSAVGLGMAETVEEVGEALGGVTVDGPARKRKAQDSGAVNGEGPLERLDKLDALAREKLMSQLPGGGAQAKIRTEQFLLMRYAGTDVCTIVPRPKGDDFHQAFIAQHRSEFGFVLGGRSVVADAARVRAIASVGNAENAENATSMDVADGENGPPAAPEPVLVQSVYFSPGGRVETPVFKWDSIPPGGSVSGPALIVSGTSTVVVEPFCTAVMGCEGSLLIRIGRIGENDESDNKNDKKSNKKSNDEIGGGVDSDPCALDAVRLSVFSHRFMSIAEQMGRTLQRTSVSTNIKERLDFSCALFGPDGGLVSNAPSIPVHLGAMSEAVRWQMRLHGLLAREDDSDGEEEEKDDGTVSDTTPLEPGDVLVTNHPAFGGSHLPDITVITPVFEHEAGGDGSGDGSSSSNRIVFFVASRGHHADIGGSTPGSMPPFSQSLYEEGLCVRSMKLVRRGVFDESAAVDALVNFPSRVPTDEKEDMEARGVGITGTRNLADNISDLRAQVAANQKGINLVRSLIAEYTLPVVNAYMGHVQSAATDAVREMLCRISIARGLDTVGTLRAEDSMDDGTPICVSVTIDRGTRTAKFDFAGTGKEVLGNTNAPVAVTRSAVIYCLRSLVDRDVPLNEGCLAPVEIAIEKGSILRPSRRAAVVGGNVLTSMRVTDAILAAFGACAGSQGCLNNVTFGTGTIGYYETIAGGAGAGPNWHGQSAVHSHMSNTRITDAEILERRYPVILRKFAIRKGSGGKGRFNGGEGVIRELEFTSAVRFSVLSERRVLRPRGLCGGGDGATGQNQLVRKGPTGEETVINLGGKNSARLRPGDMVRIVTPGAGGYGEPEAGAD